MGIFNFIVVDFILLLVLVVSVLADLVVASCGRHVQSLSFGLFLFFFFFLCFSFSFLSFCFLLLAVVGFWFGDLVWWTVLVSEWSPFVNVSFFFGGPWSVFFSSIVIMYFIIRWIRP